MPCEFVFVFGKLWIVEMVIYKLTTCRDALWACGFLAIPTISIPLSITLQELENVFLISAVCNFKALQAKWKCNCEPQNHNVIVKRNYLDNNSFLFKMF